MSGGGGESGKYGGGNGAGPQNIQFPKRILGPGPGPGMRIKDGMMGMGPPGMGMGMMPPPMGMRREDLVRENTIQVGFGNNLAFIFYSVEFN